MKRFLIGCPVMETYEECMERWLSAVEAFNWGNNDILLIDTGEGRDFCDRWNDRVQMHHLGLGRETGFRRIALGMDILRRTFLDCDYDYLLCVEIDVIPPPNTPFTMHLMMAGGGFDYVAHTYPVKRSLGQMIGFGCTIFGKKLMREVDFTKCPDYIYPDTWLWEFVISRTNQFKTCKVHGFLDIDHRDCGLRR